MTAFIQLLARVMIALIFILAGVGKIQDPAGTIAYMESMNVPGFLVWPTIALEILGGLALALGYKTKRSAFALTIFTLLAAGLFHRNFADQIQLIMFLKDIAIAGGLLLLAVGEKNKYSLDNRRTEHDFFGTRLG